MKIVAEKNVDAFLQDGWLKQGIKRGDARNRFSDLSRQALEQFFRARGLREYALSGWQTAWWPPSNVAPQSRVSFRWGNIDGSRQIQGLSAKRRMNWHFAVSVAARTAPVRHVRILSRLIFTEDGQKPFEDSLKMHRLRRSFAKTWRNARWRDMLLAFLNWLAEGRSELVVPVSSSESLILTLPPMIWMAPISMPLKEEDAEPDDDDPSEDDDVDEFEEGADHRGELEASVDG